MGISTLMSAAHAAGYAMGVPEELHEEHEQIVPDLPDANERAASVAQPETSRQANWASVLGLSMREWLMSWSGRAHA